MTGLRVVPVDRDHALAFIRRVHRHHAPPLGYRYALGVACDGVLVGVATAGRPVARALQDGYTVEVTRVATDGTPNACSMLYGACWRAARALGFTRAVTYTQADETGASLRAAGWLRAAELPARSGWDVPGRPRADRGTDGVDRWRWEIRSAAHLSGACSPVPGARCPVPGASCGCDASAGAQLDLLADLAGR